MQVVLCLCYKIVTKVVYLKIEKIAFSLVDIKVQNLVDPKLYAC